MFLLKLLAKFLKYLKSREIVRLNILWYATLLHATWGILVLYSADSLGSTPLAILAELFPGHIRLGLWLLGVAVLSLWGLFTPRNRRLRTLLLLPQQFFLSMSAVGGILAATRGMYADGVVRPHLFILTDQLPIILAAVAYAIAVITDNGVNHVVASSST